MAGTAFDEARLDVRVERDLRRDGHADEARASGPGARSRSRSTTADQLGRPVAAELSLALVDRSLLRLFDDRLPPIGPFFYDQTADRGVRDRVDATRSATRRRPCRCPRRSSRTRRSRRRCSPTPRSSSEAQGGGRQHRRARDRRARAGGRPRRPRRAWPACGGMMRSSAGRGRRAGPPRQGRRGQGWCREASSAESRSAPMPAVELSDTAADAKAMDIDRGAERFGRLSRRDAADGEAGRRGRGRPAQRFVETAYWNPRVVTGKDGKAPRHLPRPDGPVASTASPPGASPAPTPSSARPRPTWPSARTSSST